MDEVHQNSIGTCRNLFQRHRQKSEGVGKVFSKGSDKNPTSMASDRMRKKIKDYAEIFGHIMRKHALIMRKLHRIMRKLKQVIKLIIRPVQCIYMLTVNP